MNAALRILSLVRPYRSSIGVYGLFIILSSAFGVVSVAMVIPFLNVIFDRESGTSDMKAISSDASDIFDQMLQWVRMVKSTQGPESALLYISLGIIALFFLKNLFRYLAIKVLTPVRSEIIFNLRKRMFDKMNKLSIGFFTEQRKGDLLTRISSDIGEVEWAILASLSSLIENPVKILLSLIFLFTISFELSLIMLLVLPISGFLIGRVGKTLRKSGYDSQAIVDKIMSLTEETIGAGKIVRAFNAEKYVTQKYQGLNRDFTRIHMKMLNRKELSSPMGEFLGSLVVALIMYLGGLLILKGFRSGGDGLTPETFIAFILTFSQLISPAKAMANTVYNLQKGMSSLDRIEELLNQEEKILEDTNPLSLDVFQSEIRFKDVSFTYEQEPVLSDINLSIKKGERIAIVGPSGAGKSTLSDLIPRFYDVSKGSIEIDGTDIRKFSLYSLRDKMGIVPQQSILFNDTIWNNICFGDANPDYERAKEAAVHAYADAFISQLELGYETMAGEGGSRLSGGQRQRIAIARALYKNPDILILDEATSALDSESEVMVQKALEVLMENRTSLVIAHRLSTIRKADKIVVMDAGRIVESGTHEELMALQSVYFKMVQLQNFAH